MILAYNFSDYLAPIVRFLLCLPPECVCLHVDMCLYVCMYASVQMHTQVKYVCTHYVVCVYMPIYIHIYPYLCMYIYVHMSFIEAARNTGKMKDDNFLSV